MSPSHLAVVAAMLVSGALINMPSCGAASIADPDDIVDTGIFAKTTRSAELDRHIVASPRDLSASVRFYSRLDRWRHTESEDSTRTDGIAANRFKVPN
jgi:hypothetical protein